MTRALKRTFWFRVIAILVLLAVINAIPARYASAVLPDEPKDSKQQQQVRAFPFAPLLIIAGAGAAIAAGKYTAEYFILKGMGQNPQWNWYDFAGQASAGALWAMAGALIMIFTPAVLSDVFGAADQAGVAGALDNILGDLFESSLTGITSAWDALFNNVNTSIASNTAEFNNRFSATWQALCAHAGYTPDPGSFDPVWADFRENVIQSSGMSVQTTEMEYNVSYGSSWRMLNPGTSRLICSFNLSAIPPNAILSLTHLTAGDVNAPGGGYSPVDIYVNSRLFKDNFDVAQNHSASHSLEVDQWDISNYLVPDQNTIRIEFEDSPWAYTHYWIQNVAVLPGKIIQDSTPPRVIGQRYETSRATNIYVTFSEDMNGATLNGSNVTVYGSQSGLHSSQINFNHSNYELTINPATDFSYGENVTVTVHLGVSDIAGNTLASPYVFGFAIESSPSVPPTSMNVAAALSPNSGVPAHSIVGVSGSASYNTGGLVPVGIVDINTGENVYTASINNGAFSRNISAPSSSRNIVIAATDDQYGLTRSVNQWIDIQGQGPTNSYTLDTYTIYDYYYNPGISVEWLYKEAFRTTDGYVSAFAYFTNLNNSHDLHVMFRFYRPDGSRYGDDIYSDYYVPAGSHGWSFVTEGWLIDGNLMSQIPGRYRIDTYVDEGDGYEKKRTNYYVIAWDFTEHRLCKDVQPTDPYLPIVETDVFYQTDAQAMTWANFDLVAQSTEFRCLFYEPGGTLYAQVNTTDWPDYGLKDPVAPRLYWGWYRAWAFIGINGSDAANKCGDWHARLFVKNPTLGTWTSYYDEYFRILENPNHNPVVSVSISPGAPIESQSIHATVAASDNTYLKRVVLYWDDGTVKSQAWDNVYSNTLNQARDIGPYSAGQQITYWARAWDTSDNQTETVHSAITVSMELASDPNRPEGQVYRGLNVNGVYSTGGSGTTLGHAVEFQFDWGDGQQSPWGASTRTHSWATEGVYLVEARSRCAVHTNCISNWSSALMITVAVCSIPTMPSLENPPSNFVSDIRCMTLQWSAVDGASGYEVQIGRELGKGEEAEVASTQYDYLVPGGKYYWRVKTKDAFCEQYGSYSPSDSFTVQGGDAAYVGLYADQNRSSMEVFRQSPYQTFDMYIFWWPSSQGIQAAEFSVSFPPQLPRIATIQNPDITVTLGTLETGITIVYAEGDCQSGWQWSHKVQCLSINTEPNEIKILPHPGLEPPALDVASCLPGYPIEPAKVLNNLFYNKTCPTHSLPAPTLVAGSACKDISGTLDWDDVQGAMGYMVQLATSCGDGMETFVTSSSYDYSGLEPGTQYSWRVATKSDYCRDVGTYSSCESFVVTGWLDATNEATGDAVSGFGMAWGDYNNDGYLDIYISNAGTNKLCRNNSGSFVDASVDLLKDTGNGRGAVWGDYDNDGNLDLFLGNNNSGLNRLFQNEGNGNFVEVNLACFGNVEHNFGASWIDFDNDGDLDLFCANAANDTSVLLTNFGNTLYNMHVGSCIEDIGQCVGVAWGDYDNDGDQDLYLSKWGQPNRFFRNDEHGKFVDVTTGLLAFIGNGQGVAWADYDNDGNLDLLLANDGGGVRLFHNSENGTFADASGIIVAEASNVHGMAWGDYDNDGFQDLYLACNGRNLLLRNENGNGFVDVTHAVLADSGNTRGVAFADYNNDGRLDLYMVNNGSSNRLLDNRTNNGNHWIEINLRGTQSNRSVVGARVRIVAGGKQQIREVSAGSGYLSQPPLRVHFGLGTATVIDTVEVRWPRFSDELQRLTAVSADAIIDIEEVVPTNADLATPTANRLYPSYPNPFNPITTIQYEMSGAGRATLKIFDVKGNLIRTLADGHQELGRHSCVWDGTDDSGRKVSSGVFFYQLQIPGYKETKKMVLLR